MTSGNPLPGPLEGSSVARPLLTSETLGGTWEGGSCDPGARSCGGQAPGLVCCGEFREGLRGTGPLRTEMRWG